MKKITLSLLIILLLTVSCSCSDTKSLKVNSMGLEVNKLKSEELIMDIYSTETWYSVSLHDDKLWVEEDDGLSDNAVLAVDYGYYVGVNIGEFAGWVAYCPYEKDFVSDSVLVVPENFCGFVRTDRIKVLLLTGIAHMDIDKGKLYLLERGEATELYDFNSMPRTYTWDGEILYIFTGDKLYSYKLGDTPIMLTENKDYSDLLYPRSAVKLGKSIYCGCRGGIYEYCLDTGMEYWYPIK